MSVPERYWHFTDPATRARVAKLANIADEDWMQDWPLEVVDPERTAEFLDLLDASQYLEEAFSLVELLLGCLDELPEDQRNALWPRLANHVLAHPAQFAYPLIYWSCLAEGEDGHWSPLQDPDEQFPTTPLARAVLKQIAPQIGFHELRMS